MTTPGGSAPDGAYVVGSSYGSDVTKSSAMAMATNGSMNSWGKAQTNMKSEFVTAQLVNGEVVRLDNRIDEILIGTERAFLYTYSESDVWEKHPAAYKIVVDVLSGATGGYTASGGWSGGWGRIQFTGSELEDLPNTVAINVGAGTSGGSSANAGSSSFGTFLEVFGATRSEYGPGSRTYKMRGGNGGTGTTRGTAGSDGPFNRGGSGGAYSSLGNGGHAGHGFSLTVGQIGAGSAGGGGGGSGIIWGVGGNGGHGGWPSAPGGGRGYGAGALGGTGNGAGGAVFVTVYVADELGIPPSTPTNLAFSNVTSSSFEVTWDASIDDVMVKNYVLFLDSVRYGVVTATSNQFVGLDAATTYSVQVQAVDVGDNASELSAALQIVTLP